MIKLCKYEHLSNSYHDIVLLDTKTNHILILDSLDTFGNTTKFNGNIYPTDEADRNERLFELKEFTINHFPDIEEITVEDLMETTVFTVVVNGDTILSRCDLDGDHIHQYNFKKEDSILKSRRKTIQSKDYPFEEIDSIQNELIFKKKDV